MVVKKGLLVIITGLAVIFGNGLSVHAATDLGKQHFSQSENGYFSRWSWRNFKVNHQPFYELRELFSDDPRYTG